MPFDCGVIAKLKLTGRHRDAVSFLQDAQLPLALFGALGMIRCRKKGSACIFGSTCSSWAHDSPRAAGAAVPFRIALRPEYRFRASTSKTQRNHHARQARKTHRCL